MAQTDRPNVKAKPNTYPRKPETPPEMDDEFRKQIRGGEAVALLVYALTKTYPRSVQGFSFLTQEQKEDFNNKFILAVGTRPRAWVKDSDGRLTWGLAPPRVALVSLTTGSAPHAATKGDWHLDADGRLTWGPGDSQEMRQASGEGGRPS